MPFAPDRQGDGTVLGEFGGIAEQVDQALAHFGLVGIHVADSAVLADNQFKTIAFPGQQRADGGGDIARHFGHLERFGVYFHLFRLDLGQVEDIVDEAQKMAGIGLDLAHVLQQRCLPQVPQLLLQHFAVADHSRQRRAQFMAHIGKELALGAIGGFGRLLGCGKLDLAFLALGNVGMGADPFAHQHVAIVHDRHGPHQHVPPVPRAVLQPVLGLEDRMRRDGLARKLQGGFPVIGMHRPDPAEPFRGFERLAGERGPFALRIGKFQGWRGRPDNCHGCLDQVAKSFLAALQAQFRTLANRIVDHHQAHALRSLVRPVAQGKDAHDKMLRSRCLARDSHLGLDARAPPARVEHALQDRGERLAQGWQQGPEFAAGAGLRRQVAHACQRRIDLLDAQAAVEEAEADRRIVEHAIEQAGTALALAAAQDRLPGEIQRGGQGRAKGTQGQQQRSRADVALDSQNIAARRRLRLRNQIPGRIHGALAARQQRLRRGRVGGQLAA